MDPQSSIEEGSNNEIVLNLQNDSLRKKVFEGMTKDLYKNLEPPNSLTSTFHRDPTLKCYLIFKDVEITQIVLS